MKKILSLTLALLCVFAVLVGMSACAPTEEPAAPTGVTETERTEAKNVLSAYVNPEDYRESQKAQLSAAIADGNAAIDAATTKEEVASALANAKLVIDAIKTDATLTAEELAAAKEAAKSALEGYRNAEDYRDAEKTALESAIANGKSTIDGAETVAAVSEALANAKATIDAIKTDADLTAEELATAKSAAKSELDGYVNAENYRDEEKETLATAIANGKAAIDAATTKEGVTSALTSAKLAIDAIKTDATLTAEELAAAKEAAKSALEGYRNAEDYRDEEKTALESAIADGKSAIDGAETVAAVSEALANAKATIDAIKTDADLTAEELTTAKSAAKSELDGYVNAENYRDEERETLATAIANGKAAIDAATTKEGVTSALTSAKLAIDAIKTDATLTAEELAAAKEAAKSALEGYRNAEDYRDEEKTALESAIADGKSAIDGAETVGAVSEALANAKATIDAIKTDADLTAEELATAKSAAKSELDGYADASKYRKEEKATLANEISKGKSAIDGAETVTAVNEALANAKTAIDKIETDAQITAKEPTIRTILTDGAEYTSNRMTADFWVYTADGAKLDDRYVTVTVNGETASVNWSDGEKTSYNLVFVEGENTVVVTAVDGKYRKSLTYTVIYNADKPTEITISIDAFTIGLGYIVEPFRLVLDDATLTAMAEMYGYADAAEMKEAMTGAYVLDYVLKEHSLEMSYTGGGLSAGSGFYIASMSGMDTSGVCVPDVLLAKLEENGFSIDKINEAGTLGEFDVTYGSGWMYHVNGTYPNVGFSDYVPQGGDVICVRFTLAYGMDLGSTMMGDIWFEDVNPSTLTALIAEALEQGIDVTEAVEVISTFGVTQDEIDAACETLRAQLNS